MRPGLFLCALVMALLSAVPASAHPLGNFTINHLAKVRTSARAIAIKYVLDIAEIPSFQIMHERGIDGSRRDPALARWAQDEIGVVTTGLHVTADGHLLELRPGAARAITRPGAGGLPLLYWTDEFRAALPSAAIGRIEIVDGVYPGRIGWKDIVVAPDTEPTHELRSYPNALLGSPRDVAGVALRLSRDGRVIARSVTSDQIVPTPAGSASLVRSSALSDMLAKGAANPWIVLLTLAMAIGLGALHALEPGHGKTLLAVSLVGARATSKQALVLAVALTFAHTAGVLALGVLMLAAAQWIVPENVYPWVTFASGAIVAALGANALSRYVKSRRGEAHDHGHDHGHEHRHEAPAGDAPLSFKSVVLVAMTGNIAPCPAALVVLLAALTLHQLAYGLVVVVAFSIGLAAVLTGLGIALVHGAAWASNWRGFDALIRYGPLVTACVISVIGAGMLGQGAAASSLHAPVLIVALLALAAVAGYAFSPGHVHVHRSTKVDLYNVGGEAS